MTVLLSIPTSWFLVNEEVEISWRSWTNDLSSKDQPEDDKFKKDREKKGGHFGISYWMWGGGYSWEGRGKIIEKGRLQVP